MFYDKMIFKQHLLSLSLTSFTLTISQYFIHRIYGLMSFINDSKI